MRWIVTAVVATALVAGSAACAKRSPKTATATATASATVADQTAVVCATATSRGTAVMAEFKTKMTEGQQALLAGDQARAAQIEAELRQLATSWADELERLSDRPVRPDVAQVLKEMAATINTLNRADNQTPVNEVEATFTQLASKLTAACAQ